MSNERLLKGCIVRKWVKVEGREELFNEERDKREDGERTNKE